MSMEEAIKREIGETAGYVSLCWEPKPTGVFDSETAARAVEESVARLYADHVAAVAEARMDQCNICCTKRELEDDLPVIRYGNRRYREGYAAGVRDAREAVAAVEQYVNIPYESPSPAQEGEQGDWLMRRSALAAIDALREEEKP